MLAVLATNLNINQKTIVKILHIHTVCIIMTKMNELMIASREDRVHS